MRPRLLMLLVVLPVVISNVQADIVVSNPGGTGAWEAGVQPNQNNADAFWDNSSKDGAGCNVGYWLQAASWSQTTGIGQRCSNDSFQNASTGPQRPLSFFAGADNPSTPAAGDGNGETPVGWELRASGPNTVQLRLEVAGWKAGNSFGYYFRDASNNYHYQELFAGSVDPNASALIDVAAGDRFGFYLCPNGNCNARLYSGAAYNSSNGRSGKFALFSEIPVLPGPGNAVRKYWVGVEDTAGSDSMEGWGDFNDLLISATAVPEPGFVGLLFAGLAALLFASWRMRKASREA